MKEVNLDGNKNLHSIPNMNNKIVRINISHCDIETLPDNLFQRNIDVTMHNNQRLGSQGIPPDFFQHHLKKSHEMSLNTNSSNFGILLIS